SFALPRLVAGALIDAEETLAREAEAHAGDVDVLVAVVDPVVAALKKVEERDAPDPGIAILVRVEVQVAVDPARREPDPVQERRVHHEAAIVVLDLRADRPAILLEKVGRLEPDTGPRSI